jgi:GTP-dependent phosphoenolpyruvate carboxykinase
MSMIEKQAKLGRELLELNVDTVRKFAELSSENFRRYMELNQNYAQKLPEIREVGAFVELQRDYGQSLWEGVREDFKARGDIVRTAVEHTGTLVRGAFGSEPEAGEGEAEAAVEAA